MRIARNGLQPVVDLMEQENLPLASQAIVLRAIAFEAEQLAAERTRRAAESLPRT
jgi:hypothetical protein